MPTGMLRCQHGADRVMLGPPLGCAVLVCPGMPRPAYVGPQKALRGFFEERQDGEDQNPQTADDGVSAMNTYLFSSTNSFS
jgi:hypothetical protein